MDSPRFFLFTNTGIASQRKAIQCSLCPRNCLIADGKEGSCRVRQNRNGRPALPFYGYITALANDPIEKKPLYHFRPGTKILSAGFTGCNLYCPFCQNWQISQNTDVSGRFYTPDELMKAASKTAVAYTYSEPLVHFEYLLECMKEAKKAGVANVLVTNGCINSDAAAEILELCDAANIDLKCFSEETYSKVLGGSLGTVLDFIGTACRKGVHVELSTLIVPGLNDSEQELDACAEFISGLENSEEREYGKLVIPWHLSAYHPDWKWKAPSTPPSLLKAAADRARRRLSHVYTGNIAAAENETVCTHCGQTQISRIGYRVDISGLTVKKENGEGGLTRVFCSSCGNKAPIKF